MSKKSFFTFVSILLVIALLSSSVFSVVAAVENSDTSEQNIYENHTESDDTEVDDESETIPSKARQKAPIASVGAGAWDGTTVYSDGVIYIANYNQLSSIGTNTEVKDTDTNSSTFGQGNVIHVSGSGTQEDPYVNLTYSSDATYFLTDDIPLPSRTAWTVPSDFTDCLHLWQRTAKTTAF